EREEDAFDCRRQQREQDAYKRVLAPAIGNSAANEGQNREGKARDLVGPQERLMKKHACRHVGKHDAQLAEQRHNQKRGGETVEQACEYIEPRAEGGGRHTDDVRFRVHRRPRAVATDKSTRATDVARRSAPAIIASSPFALTSPTPFSEVIWSS